VIGPTDIGKRVVIRRFVGLRDGRPTYSDVLGTLTGFGEVATVQTSRGPVTVPVGEITAGKPVPPRARPSGADIAALERAASAAWPAPHTARLGGWQLRAAGGWTGRANSVLPLGDPGAPLDTALAEITRWYAGFGLPARVNVPLPLRIDLDRALAERGWQRSRRSLVQSRALAGLAGDAGLAGGADLAGGAELAGGADRAGGADLAGGTGLTGGVSLAGGGGLAGGAAGPVRLAEAPDEPWLALMAGAKGALPEVARSILTGPAQVRFASVPDEDGAPLAIARGAVTDGRLQLALIQVVPAARRQGLARQLIAALAGWAAALGAGQAYLQVEEVNTAATTLYASLGFTTHHSYFTWTAPRD
jgi:GNAT superfamily N-acetyltransferase